MLYLSRHWRDMSFVRGGLFFGRGARIDSTITAIVANVVDRNIVDDRGAVDVVNVRDIHVVHCTVVIKMSVVPTSSFITSAEVTESVNDPSIETHMRTPVSLIKNKASIDPSPIGWGPQQTGPRSQHPCARHPVIIAFVVVVGPIAGYPDITLGGADRLFVHGQCGRSDRD